MSEEVEGRPPPPLGEDEQAFRQSLEKLVDWVRVEPTRLFARAFAPALALIPLGGSLVAATVSAREPAPSLGLLLLGVLLIACGPIWALYALIQAMKQDTYVAIRVDGLAVRLDGKLPEALYAWESIEQVRAAPKQHAVHVELDSGERVALAGPFAGVTEQELAQRIRDARRLAVWSRLTPRLSGA